MDVSPAGAFCVVFIDLAVLFYLEGLMICIVETQYWDPESWREVYPRAYKIHKVCVFLCFAMLCCVVLCCVVLCCVVLCCALTLLSSPLLALSATAPQQARQHQALHHRAPVLHRVDGLPAGADLHAGPHGE